MIDHYEFWSNSNFKSYVNVGGLKKNIGPPYNTTRHMSHTSNIREYLTTHTWFFVVFFVKGEIWWEIEM